MDQSYYQHVSEIADQTRSSLPPGRGRMGRGMWKKLKRLLRFALVSICVALPVLYAADYLALRFKIPKSRQTLGVVQIDSFYAIHEKGGKTEFDYNGSENQTCVHSLFPHFGYSPCWYLSRRSEKRTDL
jgi:hypothetical protein